MKPLLILYRPGARGDFLASILLNIPFENTPLVGTPKGYKKTHFIDDPNGQIDFCIDPFRLSDYLSVRIALKSKEDFMRVLYYRFTKTGLWNSGSMQEDLEQSIIEEQRFRNYDSKFNHVVPLSFLNDYNLIVLLARKVNQTVMLPELALAVRDNIELNRPQGPAWDQFIQQFDTELSGFRWPKIF